MKSLTILAISAAMATAFSGADAADFVLDTTPDPTPDGNVRFTLTVPYALTNMHPDAASFAMRCRISIRLPRNAEATAFNFDHFDAPGQTVDLTETPVGADGYRAVSGELTYVIDIPAADATNMLRDDAQTSYRCDAGLTDDPSSPGSIVINSTNTENASLPYWGKGESSGHGGGAVSGRILPRAPSVESESDRPPLTIDPDLIRKKAPFTPKTPKLPKKD